MSAAIIIEQATPAERLAAFNLAYQRLPDEERRLRVVQALHFVDTGVIDPEGIWIARHSGTVAGVQICLRLGGANFLFWLPETRGPVPVDDLEDRLVQAALAWCRASNGKIAQAILVPDDADRARALERGGFARTTQLFYLEHNLHDLPTEPAPAGVRVEPYTSANDACFRQTLARTYEGTLDCPELNGVRTIDEILAGYRAASPFNPARWWLVWCRAEPAGVVIVTELPESAAWDLSYLGIVPEQRRRGLGRWATRRVLDAARIAGAAELLVAVDAPNVPARQLYAALGFVESAVRDVYLQFLQAGPR